MKKPYVLASLMTVPLALTIAGCGPDREEEEVSVDMENGEEPAKPESLTIWANDEEAGLEATREILENYEEKTGIEVTIQAEAMLEQTEQISLDGPGGSGPDLFYQPHDRIGDIHLQGLAAPLELSEDKVSEYQEEAIHAMTYEETLYGIPAVTETYAMYYNTEIVEEPPETLSEITALADDLTDRDNNEFGFLIEAANFYWSYPFFSGPGGYVFAQDEDGNYDTSDIGLNNEGAVEGAEQIQEWFMNGWIPTGLDDDVLDGLFTDGSVGVVVSGPWSLPGYRNALGDNLAVASLPTTDEGESLNSFAGVKGWLVSNFIESDRQYWATDLALYMTSQESSEIYFETAGELPARDDVIESDLIQEDEFFAGFAQQVQHAEAMPNVPEMSQVWDPMSDALQFISQGEDPKEVLDEAVEQIEAEIQIQGQ